MKPVKINVSNCDVITPDAIPAIPRYCTGSELPYRVMYSTDYRAVKGQGTNFGEKVRCSLY